MKQKFLKGVSANVILLGVVSFLNDLSTEMITPILPMFIREMGSGGIIVGLIGGLRDFVSSFLKVFGGYWSDRVGRRKIFVFFGYLTSGIFKLFLAFSHMWQQILFFAGMERVGKGLRESPRDALIAESMLEEKGKGFGIHRALDTSGAIFGSIIVFLLFWFFKFDFKLIILLAAIIAFPSLIPLYFVKEERKVPQNVTLKMGFKNLTKPLKLFILVSSIFALANFSYMFFILKAQESFTGKLSIGVPLLLYFLFNIFYAVFAIPFGVLSDIIGREKIIISGYLLFSLTSLGFALSHSLIAFIVLFALYGIVHALIDGNQRAFVSDLSPAELRATALGTFHTSIGLMTLAGSLIAGYLWQNIAITATFVYGALVSTISAVLCLTFKKTVLKY